MELKPAHDASFQENLSEICTDRLWRVAIKATKVPPLPEFSVWVTGEAWYLGDKRTLWQRLMRVPKEISTRCSIPTVWEFSCYGGVGRKDRKLVVRLSIKWKVKGDDRGDFWWNQDEEVPSKDYPSRFHCFVTDVEIFPLTPQQAAFVGAKYVTSESSGLFWGTAEDIAELESRFPISRPS